MAAQPHQLHHRGKRCLSPMGLCAVRGQPSGQALPVFPQGDAGWEERKRRRTGTLADKVVSPTTRNRYLSAVSLLLSFWRRSKLAVLSAEVLDERVSTFLEELWSQGGPSSTAATTLAALHYFKPQWAPYLRKSWKLYRAWLRTEPPARATPISPTVVLGLAGHAMVSDELDMAVLILVGFDCMLRSGELMKLKCKDVKLYARHAVISLPGTKTGQRHGNDEAVILESAVAVHWLTILCQSLHPQDLLLQRSAASFRRCFTRLCHHFGMEAYNFKPYSLRRGGATYDFLKQGSMERTLLRGRWA
eukprot:6469337-Amphidinium_carterae.1